MFLFSRLFQTKIQGSFYFGEQIVYSSCQLSILNGILTIEGSDEEATFEIEESLRFRLKPGELIFNDKESDQKWHFKSAEVQKIEEGLMSALFQSMYEKPMKEATDEELRKFILDVDLTGVAQLEDLVEESVLKTTGQCLQADKDDALGVVLSESVVNEIIGTDVDENHAMVLDYMKKPINAKHVDGVAIFKTECVLLFFDTISSDFKDLTSCTASIIESAGTFYLNLETSKIKILSQKISNDMGLFVEKNMLYFNFCLEQPIMSLALRLNNYQVFLDMFFRSLFQNINGVEMEQDGIEYLARELDDVDMNSDEIEEEEDENDDENDEVTRVNQETDLKGEKNSLLTVGYKDRSYVVRGNKIGVFNSNLEHSTTINNVPFSPKKIMLSNCDSSLLMLSNNTDLVHKMDLEYGKIVEEYQVPNVNDIVTSTKYGQQTTSQELIGINNNGVFGIDGRLSGNKISNQKMYNSKMKFSNICTTSGGNIAIGSATGDIRLYNRIGIRAATLLPGFGDAIVGIDTTGDGKYLLATCEKYITVIDTRPNNVDGYKKSSKAKPIRLSLKPEHVAWMKQPVKFTAARFNLSENSQESVIVASTGKFLVTWNFRRVKLGKKDYTIKMYEDDVVADSFKWGSEKEIVVALPEDVEGVRRSQLKNPTKLMKGIVTEY